MAGTNGNNTGGLGGFPRGRPGPVGLLKQDPRIGRALRRFSGTTLETDQKTIKINDLGQYYVADVTGVTGAGGALNWVKFTVTFSDFSTAAVTNSINLFSLAAGGVIHAVKAKHSVIFDGPGITTYKLIGVGLSGSLTKYWPGSSGGVYDMNVAVAAKTGFINYVGVFLGIEDQSSSTQIVITATANTNLNVATSGSVDVWVLISAAT